MRARPHPYRSRSALPPTEARTVDPLARAQRVAEVLVLGWAALRLVLCSLHGLDFEGCIALVLLARRFA
ncbi:MAG TPA: hypothetical protein VGG39_27900 [Polyangiaceae bacterium]|jgi:hypothetical protein